MRLSTANIVYDLIMVLTYKRHIRCPCDKKIKKKLSKNRKQTLKKSLNAYVKNVAHLSCFANIVMFLESNFISTQLNAIKSVYPSVLVIMNHEKTRKFSSTENEYLLL